MCNRICYLDLEIRVSVRRSEMRHAIIIVKDTLERKTQSSGSFDRLGHFGEGLQVPVLLTSGEIIHSGDESARRQKKYTHKNTKKKSLFPDKTRTGRCR